VKVVESLSLDFSDVLIQPKRSELKSRSEVSLVRTFKFYHTDKTWTGVPIIAANMDSVGTFEMAEALFQEKMLTAIHKHYSLDDWRKFKYSQSDKNIFNHIMVSTGTSEENFKKTVDILDILPEINFICVDIANGYSQHLVDFVKKIRGTFPDKIIVAGNIVSGNMAEELIISGADIVKVGIGPGSVCTTRLMTGVGRPQLTAIIDCADLSHGLKGHIIGDGGCQSPSDIAKAFGAGADFVMLGGMLAGHDQSGGDIVEELDANGNKKKFKKFYGMSSESAMKKHSGGVAKYRASEGKTVSIEYRGSVVDTLDKIQGGLRSTCTYIGAVSIKELPKRTTFERVTRQLNEVYGKADWYNN
jgi:GMP reductase